MPQCFHRRVSRISLVFLVIFPAPPSTLQEPVQLHGLKRFGHDIVAAQVQHLHPKVLVRESGRDNEKRIVWQKLQCRKKVFPVPRTAKPVPQ